MQRELADVIDALESKRKAELKKHEADKTPPGSLSDAKEEKKIRKKFKSLGYMD